MELNYKSKVKCVILALLVPTIYGLSATIFQEYFHNQGEDRPIVDFNWKTSYGSDARVMDENVNNFYDTFVVTGQGGGMLATGNAGFIGNPVMVWREFSSNQNYSIGSLETVFFTIQNNRTDHDQRLAVKIVDDWYATEQVFNNPGNRDPASFVVLVKNEPWLNLRFTPGEILELDSETGEVSLPDSGKLNAIGFFTQSHSSTRARIRNIIVNPDSEITQTTAVRTQNSTPADNISAHIPEELLRGQSGLDPLEIDTVDISSDFHRHVVIARGSPEIYQGHPNTVLLPDGVTMFCTWSLTHTWGEPFVARSDDAGLSWRIIPGPENWNHWQKATSRPGRQTLSETLNRGFLPHVHYLTNFEGKGRLIISDRGHVSDSDRSIRLVHSISDDQGHSWTSMSDAGIPGVEPSITILPSECGQKWLRWERALGRIYQYESSNGGKSWILSSDEPIIDRRDYPGADLIEPAVVRAPDGRQLLMFIRDIGSSSAFNSLFVTSDDDGKTWSRPNRLPSELTGDRHFPIYSKDGRLVVFFRDQLYNHSSPTVNQLVAWVGNYEDIISGNNGQYRIKLFHHHSGHGNQWPGDCGYPAVEILPDGTFIATTYLKYDDSNDLQSIVSTRFNLNETDDLLKTNNGILVPLLGNDQNDDGQPLELMRGDFIINDGEARIVLSGSTIFSDRQLVFDFIPKELSGLNYSFSGYSSSEIVCESPGFVYLLTPSEGRNPDLSFERSAIAQGFNKVAIPEFALFPSRRGRPDDSNLVTVYQKRVNKGDVIRFGERSVIIY